MIRRVFLSLIFISMLWACDSAPKAASGKVEKESPRWVEQDVTDGGYALKVYVPVPEITKGKLKVEYLDDLGELHVNAGAAFDYSMYEDESQIKSVLEEIKNHPFYQVEIVEQSDSSLLYRFYLENMDKENWQFYAERSLGDPLLIIRSNKDEMFSEFYARKMLESALKLTPLN